MQYRAKADVESLSGHLFITRGSLTRLACDAILVPSGTHDGRFGHVTHHWAKLPLPRDSHGFVTPAPDGERRVVEVPTLDGSSWPALWVGHTGETGDEPPEWYAEALGQFIREAADRPPERREVAPVGDDRPLLALPLIGTGKGGMAHRKGEIILAAVRAILNELATVDADVVLVVQDAETYTAAQQARAQATDSAWASLEASHVETARELAREARRGRLVLFMGAGTGVGAGLPNWEELIERLGERVGLRSEEDQSALSHLDPRDAGLVLDRRLREEGSALADVLLELFNRTRVSLVHQLLASLPVTEAATTNYDQLFERAWEDAGKSHAVLPRQSARDASRWLLKLHGSINEPERIVLSRDDYLRFEGEGIALAGIVQAMLLTRHMLFVGYSLSDDNFHRLVHQVRGAVGRAEERPGGRFGTALTPTSPDLFEDVWAQDVRFLNTARGSDPDARRLAILLDLIGSESAAPAAHVLKHSYDAVFSSDERTLRDHLLEAQQAAGAPGVRPAVRQAVEDALVSLRGDTDPSPSPSE